MYSDQLTPNAADITANTYTNICFLGNSRYQRFVLKMDLNFSLYASISSEYLNRRCSLVVREHRNSITAANANNVILYIKHKTIIAVIAFDSNGAVVIVEWITAADNNTIFALKDDNFMVIM